MKSTIQTIVDSFMGRIVSQAIKLKELGEQLKDSHEDYQRATATISQLERNINTLTTAMVERNKYIFDIAQLEERIKDLTSATDITIVRRSPDTLTGERAVTIRALRRTNGQTIITI